MRLILLVLVLAPLFVASAQWGPSQLSTGTVINSNRTGKQGDYYVEYWKDNGTGTMTLKEGGDFSCEWGQVNNILFRKGIRPGSRKQVVVYSADYNPQGNSYLSIYGWFENPLVEYYIIESWGTWRPPGVPAKGSVETDSGTYDIYENSRTGPSIKGNTTFKQYWSVRRTKRTRGTIHCGNHFDAWERNGMTIGTFYEVSFNVEAYQSPGGKADVQVVMTTEVDVNEMHNPRHDRPGSSVFQIQSHQGLYNALGKKISLIPERINIGSGHSVLLNNTPESASGVYFLVPEKK
jgi:hypothetical protein